MAWHSPCAPARRVAPPVPRRALVAEPEASLRTFLAHALRRVGYQVQTAATVAEALAYGRRFSPDLVLLSAALPPHGGATLRRQLRLPAEARVVLLGDSPRDGHRGADAFLPLPFTAAEFRAVLLEDGEPLLTV